MKGYIDRTRKMIEEWEKHPYDACAEIIDMMSSEAIHEPWMIVREVLSYSYRIGNAKKEVENIDQDDLNRFYYRYSDYLNKSIEMLSMNDDTEELFYQQLYSLVFESNLLPEDRNHQAFYLFFLSDQVKQVPYYKTSNLLRIGEKEYKDIFDSIKPQLSKAFHMCSRKFDTKSEKASQYWEIASELEKREEQIIFWSVVIDMEKKNNDTDDDD